MGELEQQIRDINAKHRAELESLEVDNGRLKVENIKLRDAMEHLMQELSTIRSLTRLSESPTHALQTPDIGRKLSVSSVGHEQRMVSPAKSADLELTTVKSTSTFSPLRFDDMPAALLGQSVPLRSRPKRRTTDSPATKKIKSNDGSPSSVSNDCEIDFTDVGNFRPPAGESCGFCSDGTPCLCAEAAQQHALAEEKRADRASKLHSQHRGSTLEADSTPDNARRLSVTVMPVIPEEGNGLCTGNPGSCRQCLMDPLSSLFCRTLADSAKMNIISPATTRPPLLHLSSSFSTSSARDTTPPRSELVSRYVPCSAAYQTLSKHENFDQNSLETVVSSLEVDKAAGRGVELDSVRSVLRILDLGLGKQG